MGRSKRTCRDQWDRKGVARWCRPATPTRYSLVRIRAAQASCTGSFWENMRNSVRLICKADSSRPRVLGSGLYRRYPGRE
jgi:hypothetical protein